MLNVGAGAGSYEPEDRYVLAVEPSAAMRAQRPRGRPELEGTRDSLPFSAIARISEALGGDTEVEPVPVPGDCTDRFQVALHARPEQFLDPRVRSAQSAWRFLPPGVEERFVSALAGDLASGAWDSATATSACGRRSPASSVW